MQDGPSVLCRCGAVTSISRAVGQPGWRILRCSSCNAVLVDQVAEREPTVVDGPGRRRQTALASRRHPRG